MCLLIKSFSIVIKFTFQIDLFSSKFASFIFVLSASPVVSFNVSLRKSLCVGCDMVMSIVSALAAARAFVWDVTW